LFAVYLTTLNCKRYGHEQQWLSVMYLIMHMTGKPGGPLSGESALDPRSQPRTYETQHTNNHSTATTDKRQVKQDAGSRSVTGDYVSAVSFVKNRIGIKYMSHKPESMICEVTE